MTPTTRIPEELPLVSSPARCTKGHVRLGFYLEADWRRGVRRWRCRECKADRSNRAWRDNAERRERHLAYNVAWNRRNPEKKRAQWKVNDLIRRGKWIRPKTCERCGGSERTIQASHNDYSRPFEVEWLCTMCHGAKDAAMRRAAGS